jgi:hypothetical protein
MRRTHHHDQAMQVMTYIGLNRKIVASYKEKYEKLFQGLKTDSEQNFKRKMQIFLLGLMLPVIIWFVLSNLSAIKLLIQTIINVMRIFTY